MLSDLGTIAEGILGSETPQYDPAREAQKLIRVKDLNEFVERMIPILSYLTNKGVTDSPVIRLLAHKFKMLSNTHEQDFYTAQKQVEALILEGKRW